VFTWSRGLIGCANEVFGVMTQVDLGLTNVSRFDSADLVISVNDANEKHGASHPRRHCYGQETRTNEPVSPLLRARDED
jgi:hypothetical protein